MARSDLPMLPDGGPVICPALDVHTASDLADALKALADPVRLRLLSMLAQVPDGRVSASALAGPVDRSQPTVSHHLKALRHAGLIRAERQGSMVWYSLRRGRLEELWALLDTATLPAPGNPAQGSPGPAPGGAGDAVRGSGAGAARTDASPAMAGGVTSRDAGGVSSSTVLCSNPACVCFQAARAAARARA